MVEYLENGDLALYNGYKFRKDKRTGYYLSSRIINGKRRRLHVYIWECENGEIPNGYSVHHKDEDKSNNEISNLELMTNSKHTRLHAEEKARNNYDDMLKNLKESALDIITDEVDDTTMVEEKTGFFKKLMKDKDKKQNQFKFNEYF